MVSCEPNEITTHDDGAHRSGRADRHRRRRDILARAPGSYCSVLRDTPSHSGCGGRAASSGMAATRTSSPSSGFLAREQEGPRSGARRARPARRRPAHLKGRSRRLRNRQSKHKWRPHAAHTARGATTSPAEHADQKRRVVSADARCREPPNYRSLRHGLLRHGLLLVTGQATMTALVLGFELGLEAASEARTVSAGLLGNRQEHGACP